MRVIGGVITAAGGVFVAIAFIWGSVIGYYPSQAGALFVISALGVAGLVVGGLIWKGSGKPELPAGAVLMSNDAPPVRPTVSSAAEEDTLDAEVREASDPTTAPLRLAELARGSVYVQSAVAANPSTYPALLDWLGDLGDPMVAAALAGRGETVTPHAEDLLARAADPATPPAELATLARLHPALRPTIAANPASYDGLRTWIAENP
jgi:hypothetical protein